MEYRNFNKPAESFPVLTDLDVSLPLASADEISAIQNTFQAGLKWPPFYCRPLQESPDLRVRLGAYRAEFDGPNPSKVVHLRP